MNPFSDGSSDTLAEGVVDAVSRLREPACACLRDDHVIFQTHAELTIDANRRFVGERHPRTQHRTVALHQVWPFMHIETNAVASAMR